MNKAYNKIVWQNSPSTATPLNQTNLNEMSNALDTIDDRVITLDSGKVGSVTVTNTLQTGDTIATITVDGTATNIKSAQVEVDAEPSATSENPLQNKAIYEMLNNLLPEETAEGNPISISDASGLNAKACSVDLLPIQDLHGYDSPWVGGAGKNKVPISDWFTAGETKVQDGITLTFLANGKIRISGTNTSSSATMLYLSNAGSNPPYNVWKVPSGQYTLSWNGIANTNVNLITSGGGGNNGFEYTSLSSSSKTKTSTISDGTKPFSYLIIQVGAGVTIPSNSVLEIQLEQGATATDFSPYENICPISGRTEVNLTVADTETSPTQTETYTETLGQTVYGGNVDFVSGKLTIDRVFETVTAVVKNTNTAFYYIPTSASDKVFNHVISDKLPTASAYGGKGVFLNTGGAVIFSTENEYSTASDMITAYGGSIQVCFYLATPTTLTLTAEQISLLKGNNVVSTDGDNINLIYSKKL